MTLVFVFNDTATTEIYTLSLHDALPIFAEHDLVALGQVEQLGQPFAHLPDQSLDRCLAVRGAHDRGAVGGQRPQRLGARSEEHTSELQSCQYLVCRLLLEKK